MSKYVKYISSEHFGAPELKGDRWVIASNY